MTFSGMSEENAARRRSWGDGTRCSAGGSSATGSGGAGGGGGGGSAARCCSAWWRSFSAFSSASSSAVPRNRAASGPSRMLARLPPAMGEDLLGQLAIRMCRRAVRFVLEHRHALHGRLREADGLLDARGEDPIAEVLLEDLDRFLRVQGPGIHERRQDALDVDPRVQVLPDHRKGVLELDEPAHRQILALNGDDHLVGRGERVDRQQPEARRGVDADEVVVVADRREGLLQGPLAADHRRHRDLRSRQVDRRARDVDLAAADDLADRRLVHEHVVHRQLERVGVDALRHRQVALGVHVHAQDTVARFGERDRQVQRRRRLRHAALLVGECDDFGLLLLHVSSLSIVRGTRTRGSFAALSGSPLCPVVVHWDDVAWESVDHGELRWERQRLAGGLSRYRVPAGHRLMPVHVHVDEEEYVVALAGGGLSWHDGAAYAIAAGDVVLHRADEEAHTLIAGDEGLEVLIFASGSPTGLTRLPRAGVLRVGNGVWPFDAGDPLAAEPPLGDLPAPAERPPTICALTDAPQTDEGRGVFTGRERNLGARLGGVLSGLRHDEIPPGNVSCPAHYHTGESEKFVVLEGDGAARLGDERMPIRAGSIVVRPPNTGVAHALEAGEE